MQIGLDDDSFFAFDRTKGKVTKPIKVSKENREGGKTPHNNSAHMALQGSPSNNTNKIVYGENFAGKCPRIFYCY